MQILSLTTWSEYYICFNVYKMLIKMLKYLILKLKKRTSKVNYYLSSCSIIKSKCKTKNLTFWPSKKDNVTSTDHLHDQNTLSSPYKHNCLSIEIFKMMDGICPNKIIKSQNYVKFRIIKELQQSLALSIDASLS